jgi:hypothetical protein
LIAVIGVFIVLLIPTVVLIGTVAMVEYGIHNAFATATGPASLWGVLLEVFIGAIALGFAILIGISIGGPISTAIREYALTFYGGRYQKLADTMYPPAPPIPTVGIPAV